MYEIFAKLLEEQGITPYRVYKETGVAQSTLSDWKNGKSTPSAEKLKKIANYLNVSVDYLITGQENCKKAPHQTEGRQSDALNAAFFRLKKGLEPYNISESDADFLVEVYKAHIRKNHQE